MHLHQKLCFMRPPELVRAGTLAHTELGDNDELPPLSPKKKTSFTLEAACSPLSKEKYIPALDLLPKMEAVAFLRRRPSAEITCDIELEGVETVPPAPIHLNSPTSLISQLSKEETGSARKRLNYSLSMDKVDNEVIETLDSGEDSDADVVSSSDSEVAAQAQPVKVPMLNLLNIPLTSPLGQRVKNHIHVTSFMPIVADSNEFCRTPVKNTFAEKLRKKEIAYQIVYKARQKANLHKQNHLYKFTRQQRKEFCTKVNYGLNVKSFDRFRRMKKVRVDVERMSRKTFLRWMPRCVLDKTLRGKFKGLKVGGCSRDEELCSTECEFPAGPSLLAQNIDKLLGLKKKSSQKSASALSLTNCVSEELEAEVSKQKLTLYRSLLYEMSVVKAAVVMEDIGESIQDESSAKKMEINYGVVAAGDDGGGKVLKKESASTQTDYKTLRSVLSGEYTGPYMKKGSQSPLDDSVSIMSLSSSSESESLHSSCCTGCQDVKQCQDDEACKANVSKKSQLFQPLSVKIGSQKDDIYGDTAFPSPVSVSSESPFFPGSGSDFDDFKIPSKLQDKAVVSPVVSAKDTKAMPSPSFRSARLQERNASKETSKDTAGSTKGTVSIRSSTRRSVQGIIETKVGLVSPGSKVKPNENVSTVESVKQDKVVQKEKMHTRSKLGTSVSPSKLAKEISTSEENKSVSSTSKSEMRTSLSERLTKDKSNDTNGFETENKNTNLLVNLKRKLSIGSGTSVSPRSKRLCSSSPSSLRTSPVKKPSSGQSPNIKKSASVACKLDGTELSVVDKRKSRETRPQHLTRSKSFTLSPKASPQKSVI